MTDTIFLKKYMRTAIPMWVYSPVTLKFIIVNEAAIKQYGYTQQEFLSLSILNIRPNSEHKKLIDSIGSEKEEVNEGIWLHQKKSGETFYAHVHAQPTMYDGEKATLITAIDINDKLQAELEKNQLETKLIENIRFIEQVLGSITDAFFSVDHNWCFTYINQGFEKMFGRSTKDVLGKHIWHVFDKEFGEDIYKYALKMQTDSKTLTFQRYYPPQDSWFFLSLYPSKDGTTGIFKDITREQKLYGDKLENSRNLQALINNTDDMIWSIDNDFRLIYANEKFLQTTQKNDYTLKKGDHIFTNVNKESIKKQWGKLYNGALSGQNITVEVMSNEFEHIPHYYEISCNPIINEGKITGVACISRETTERKKQELMLKKYKEAMDNSHNKNQTFQEEPIINIISQFDFSNPICGNNLYIIDQLKTTTSQLEKVINDFKKINNQ